MKTKSIKVSPETHQSAKIWAAQQGIPLGEAVEKLIKLGLKGGQK
jgi:predicted HicB family RNase H-like nuclease